VDANGVVNLSDVVTLESQITAGTVASCVQEQTNVDWPWNIIDQRDSGKIRSAIEGGWAQWLSCDPLE